MQKIQMIGITLLMMLNCSCTAPTIKNPMKMYIISKKFKTAATGLKTLDYKQKKNLVGEWVNSTKIVPLETLPANQMCISLKDWLLIVKPTLKLGADYYHGF